MTNPPLPPSPEDDLTAAEYVLGTLPHAERVAIAARLRGDAALQRAVTDWQRRLAALDAGYAEAAPPPHLWPRIENRLFPPPAAAAAQRRAGALWWGAGAAALALAALVAVALLRPLPLPPSLPGPAPDAGSLIATLQADTLRIEARHDGQSLTIRRTAGPASGAGRSYQMWLIAPGAAPASLGLLAEDALRLNQPAPPAGWVLAVSLEPEGGSVTGAPTGPVLATVAFGG